MRRFFALLLLLALAGCQGRPTMTAYTAPWCAACQADKPALAEATAVYAVEVVDADAHPERVAADGVRFLPFYVVHDGRGRELIRTADLSAALKVLGQ